MDAVYLTVAIVSFLLTWMLLRGCDILHKRDSGDRT